MREFVLYGTGKLVVLVSSWGTSTTLEEAVVLSLLT